MSDVNEEGQPISWRAITYDIPVFATGGEAAGRVREVLGSDSEDLFHGLRVELTGGHRDVTVEANDIAQMTTAGITLELTLAEVGALPDYHEEASYHLGSVGTVRHHLGWKKDAGSDEEPG